MISLPTHICVTRPQWVKWCLLAFYLEMILPLHLLWDHIPSFINCNGNISPYYMMTSSNGNIFRVTGLLCGEFTGPGDFPAQWPMTRSLDVFFDLCPNKRLNKQPWGWRFETLSCPLWRHRNECLVAVCKSHIKRQWYCVQDLCKLSEHCGVHPKQRNTRSYSITYALKFGMRLCFDIMIGLYLLIRYNDNHQYHITSKEQLLVNRCGQWGSLTRGCWIFKLHGITLFMVDECS